MIIIVIIAILSALKFKNKKTLQRKWYIWIYTYIIQSLANHFREEVDVFQTTRTRQHYSTTVR